MTASDVLIKNLKRFFMGRQEEVLAFLFGSGARGQEREDSDLDIAVLLAPDAPDGAFAALWRDLEITLKRSVDLIRMDRAVPSIAWEALRGIPLLVRDRDLLTSLILRISREAEDDQDFILSMWRWRIRIRQERLSHGARVGQ